MSHLLGQSVALLRGLTGGDGQAGPVKAKAVVVMLENLHVADLDSLALLALLVRQLGAAPVVFVLTMRTGFGEVVAEVEALVARMAAEGSARVIDVGPLGERDVADLLATGLPAPPAAELVEFVMAGSRGNPFLAIELVRRLDSEGTLRVDGGLSRLDSAEPTISGVGSGLLTRFFSMHRDEARVARVLAVFGRFSLDHLSLLSRLTGLDRARLAECLDRLVAMQLMEVSPRHGYEFAQPMLRESLYVALGDAERHYLHRAMADLLLERRAAGVDIDIFELARHVTASMDSGEDRGWRIALEAGEVALDHAPLVAAGWFAQALERMPAGDPERPTVRAKQVYALLAGAQTSEAATSALDSVTALAPSALRSDLTFATAAVFFAKGRPEQALRVVEAELAEGVPRRSLACLRVNLLAQVGDSARARQAQAALDGEDWPAESPLDVVCGDTHLQCYFTLTGQPEGVARCDARIRALLPEVPAAARISFIRLLAMSRLEGPGPLAAAGQDALAADRLQAGSGDSGPGELVQVALSWLQGAWDEALVAARQALPSLETNGATTVQPAIRAIAAMILCDRGDVDAARDVLRDSVATVAASRPYVAVARARLLRLAGHPRAAADLLAAYLDRARAEGIVSMVTLAVEELTSVELSLGRADAAAQAARAGVALVAPIGWPLLDLFGQRALATATGDVDAAWAATTIAEDNGAGGELAKCWLTLAELDVEPERHAARAWQAFQDLGATPLRARAAATLRRHGTTVPRTGPGEGVLSGVETELVRLVASGLTNRQIAEQLSYSVKTVEAYLSRIYAKTATTGRVQLMARVLAGELGELTGRRL